MPTKQVKISYIKSYDFKTSLVSGVHGGVGPNGLINANFFIDRAVLPTNQLVEIDEIGKNQKIISEEKDSDIIREVQFGILIDINTAKALAGWLQGRIKEYEEKLKR